LVHFATGYSITLFAVKKSMQRRHFQKHSKKVAPLGSIRIIAGLWRGRKLPVYEAQGLRPTTDRVKETLFNWLAQEIPHAQCLDLFAGSGGLGFEAASRQADRVTMLELDKGAYQQLSRNIDALKSERIQAIHSDALTYLAQKGQPHDVVFIDPPFRQGLLEQTIALLEQNDWLTPSAMIYIETEKELTLTGIPAHWSLYREKTAGQVCYRLFERNLV
jgi:16S rRNA (guanine966-N2)-methyltransferase